MTIGMNLLFCDLLSAVRVRKYSPTDLNSNSLDVTAYLQSLPSIKSKEDKVEEAKIRHGESKERTCFDMDRVCGGWGVGG